MHVFQQRPLWLRCGVAIFVVGALTLLRTLLGSHPSIDLPEMPHLLFLSAVMISAWYGGLIPGLLSVALSTISANFFFQGEIGFDAGSPSQQVVTGLFLVEGLCISVLSGILHNARRRAEDNALQARMLEQRILEVSEAEQRRIGQDLHDGLGQQLAGVALLSKVLEQRLNARGVPEAADMSKIAALVRETIGWTRDLAKGLSPFALEADGLGLALRELAANAERLFSLHCTVEAPDQPRIAPGHAIHFYRIAQEALSNAAKHGKARNISVALTEADNRLRLAVKDDGKGILPADQRGQGLGLQIMTYRANMMGAQLQVRRDPSGGTLLVCEGPALLEPEQHDHSQSTGTREDPRRQSPAGRRPPDRAAGLGPAH